MSAACITEALCRVGIPADDVDEVVVGQVAQVGPDAYNARRCVLAAGLPPECTAVNVNRLCSSGLQAIVTAAQQVVLDDASIVIAAGNESMTRQPFLDYGTRMGRSLGNRELVDGTLSLVTDPFGRYPMGVTADRVAARYGVTRIEQDRFALRSQELAAAAIADGVFDSQIVPIPVPDSDAPFARDEHPRITSIARLAALKPAFSDGGTVTAGNSSGINDGAAAVVVMRRSEARRRGIAPRLVLRAWTVVGIEPEVMGYAPALAVPRVLERAGLSMDDVDIVELNEAFAAQAVAVARDAVIPEEKVNPLGGAIALGHPVGATGTMLTVKLMHELERSGGRRGIVTMCIGGGQGMAALFERP
jgi:acetyl-CoA C-acetyltransferase